MLRQVVLKSTLITLLCAVSLATYARAEDRRQIDVPAGDLIAALKSLVRQSGIDLVYRSDQLEGLRTQGFRGSVSPQEAVTKLLEGTPLVVKTDSSGAMLISLPASPAAPKAEPPQSQQRAELEEVVVVGTHLRGVTSLPVPVLTMTREDIDAAGVATTEALLESMPQNFTSTTPDSFRTLGNSVVAQLNTERAVAVDLRGLGPQSTLALLNGHRQAGGVAGRVVDISTIPLSVIDSVEVVTGGRSAVYGADAVAGVVNFRTIQDYSGVRGTAYYGSSQDGGASRQVSAVAGRSGANGGLALAYEFEKDGAFDLVDARLVRHPAAASGARYLRFESMPDSEQHSVFATAHRELSEANELRVEGLYSDASHFTAQSDQRPSAAQPDARTYDVEPTQLYGSASLLTSLTPNWHLESTLYTSRRRVDQETISSFPRANLLISSKEKATSQISSGSVLLQGELPTLLGSHPKLAVGAEYQLDELDSRTALVFNGALLPSDPVLGKRHVSSAFLETFWPVSLSSSVAADISVGGRLDHYDDFGSSFNPAVGLSLKMGSAFRLTSAYSRAFRAPSLAELGNPRYFVTFFDVEDPASPTGRSYLLEMSGSNPQLDPEKARTWSAGIEYAPEGASSPRLALYYFQIGYEGRIDLPAPDSADVERALVRNQLYQSRIDRSPAGASLERIVNGASGTVFNLTSVDYDPATIAQNAQTVFPGLVLFDNRFNNNASEDVDGLDLIASWNVQLASLTLNLGANLSYTLDHTRSVTAGAPSFTLMNEPGKPVDFRARIRAGFERGRWSLQTFVNYVTDYENAVQGPVARVDDWTTVDATLRFRSKSLTGSLRDRLEISLIAQNIFDARPPLVTSNNDALIYDATNANPLGRWLAVSVGFKF